MSLIKWAPMLEPFDDMEKWFDESRWPIKMTGFTPAIDVYETKDSVVVETPLSGVDPEKVQVSIQNDVLTLKGESEHKSEVDDKNYYRKEVRYGSFFRSVALPAHVVGDKASASYENGILKVTVPKAQGAKVKTVKIKITKKK